jgi:hypothetical protein
MSVLAVASGAELDPSLPGFGWVGYGYNLGGSRAPAHRELATALIRQLDDACSAMPSNSRRDVSRARTRA